MTMVLVPSVNGGDLCLNPDTTAWVLPNDHESCQALMAGGTVYDVAMDVRAMKEVFADRFVQLMLAVPMPSRPGIVLVNPLQASSIEANNEQSSYVLAPGSKQLVVGSVTRVSAAFNNPQAA